MLTIFRALITLAACASLAQAKTPPNVLFLFADDMRADTIAALGNKVIKTPHLDALAARGTSFRRAYMQGGHHGATCVPSRAMLLSGRNLFHMDDKLMAHPSWPEAFAQQGYTTFVSGKWHNGDPSIAKTFQIARSMFTGGMTDPMKAKLRQLEQGKLTPPQPAAKHACQVFADETTRFLNEAKGPFFAYVPFDAPHDPHIVPPEFAFNYDPAVMPLPENFLPIHPFDNGEMDVRDEKLLPKPRPEAGVRKELAEYYRYISYLDSLVGQILAALDASPHKDNTYIVFTADSGVARGSHGLIGKQNLYEHSIRVPLLIAGPGIPAGARTDAACYLYDALPTLGKLCGIPAPATSEGREFTAALADPAQPARAELVFAYRQIQRAIQVYPWNYIHYPKAGKSQLFDLSKDPEEMKNLADAPSAAGRRQELEAKLRQLLTESGDSPRFSMQR